MRSPAASASGSRSRGPSRAIRRCSCSTSRWPPSTRTRARRCASELREVLAGLAHPDRARDPRLRGRGRARGRGRRDRRGPDPPGRHARGPRRRSREPLRRELHRRDAASGTAAPGRDGLTEVSLDAGLTAWSTDPGEGRVALGIYPWEVSIAREIPADTAVNHVRAPIVSLVELGNRVRLRVGPLAAEVTAGVRDAPRPARGRGRRRVVQGDGRTPSPALTPIGCSAWAWSSSRKQARPSMRP